MSIWAPGWNEEAMLSRGVGTMVTHLGIEFVEMTDDSLTFKMPVDHRTHQPLGIMHGGASCVLAESVGSTAANMTLDFTKQYAVGLDINTNHIKSIREGWVYGTAKPFHTGRTTQVWGIDIVDEDGTLISVTRLTMAVLNHKALV